VFRTRYGGDALLDLEPLAPRAAVPHELLAIAYRAIFLERFESVPAQSESIWSQAERRHGVARADWARLLPDELPAQLAQLSALAERALGIAAGMLRAAGNPAELKLGADRLAACDREIFAATRAQPLLAPLALSLEGGLEGLPDADVDELIQLSAAHYAALARGAALLANLTSVPGVIR
jgi:hypothetical protein